MQRFAALAIGVFLVAACSSTTGPLPCSDDAHCPSGDYCGSDGNCAALPSSFSIAITPAAASITVSKTLQFKITGDGGATWAVQEAAGGSIAADGTYQAPATAGTFHIVATSTADATKTATAVANVVAAPVATVSAPTLVQLGAVNLVASVANQPDSSFAWTIMGGQITAGASTNQITFTAGIGTTMLLTCLVTNAAGTSISGSAAITVSSTPIAPQINAPTALDQGATNINISIDNPSTQLIYQWTITGGAFADGTMSATGSTQTINAGSGTSLSLTCVATNSANQSAMSTATIALVPSTQVPSISAPGYLTISKTTTLNIASAQTGVTFSWTLTDSNGSSFGTTAPAQPVNTATGATVSLTAGATAGDVQLAVTATNAADDQRSATAVIHVVSSVVADAPTVVINPGSSFPGYLTKGAQAVGAAISNPITDGTITYQWTIAGGTITSPASGASVTFNAGSATSVTLQAIAYNQAGDPSPGGEAIDTLVDLPSAPTINTTAAIVTSGVSGKGASIAAPATGVTYFWTITGGTFDGTSGSTQASGTTISFTATVGAPSVALMASGLNLAGDPGANGSANVTVVPAVIMPTLTVASTVSSGKNNLAASVASPQANVTYSWKMSGGGSINGSVPAGDGSTQATGTSIVYTSASSIGSIALAVTATNAAGDQLATNATITVVPAPSGTLTIYPCCSSTGTPITAATVGFRYFAGVALDAGQGTTTYAWTLDDGASGSSTSSTLTLTARNATASISGGSVVFAAPMHVTCRITNAAGDFKDLTEALVVYPPASAQLTVNGLSAQSGSGNFFVSAYSKANVAAVAAQPGASYSWTVGIPMSAGGSLMQASLSFDALSGAFNSSGVNVTVTNGAGDSTSQAGGTVEMVTAPSTPFLQISPYYFSGRGNPSIALLGQNAIFGLVDSWTANGTSAPFYDGTTMTSGPGILSNASAAATGTLIISNSDTDTQLPAIPYSLPATALTTGLQLVAGAWGNPGIADGTGVNARISLTAVSVAKATGSVFSVSIDPVNGADALQRLTNTSGSWSISSYPSTGIFFSASAVNDTTVFGCRAPDCQLYQYADGSWTGQDLGSTLYTGGPGGISAVDASTVFIAALLDGSNSSSEVDRLISNGTSTWTKSVIPLPTGAAGWMAIHAVDANTIWLAACMSSVTSFCGSTGAATDIFLATYSSVTSTWALSPIIPTAALPSILFDRDGPATQASFGRINSIDVLSTYQLVVGEVGSIRLVTSTDSGVTWTVSSVPIAGQVPFGQGINALSLAALNDGTLLWGDNQSLYQVTNPTSTQPVASLVLGVPSSQSGYDGIGSAARVNGTTSIAGMGSSSNTYLVGGGGVARILQFQAASSTWAVSTPGNQTGYGFAYPSYAPLSASTIAFADQSNNTIATEDLSSSGCPQGATIPCWARTNIAGSPGVSGTADGLGSAASFSQLGAIAIGDANTLLVADRYNVLRLLTNDVAGGTGWTTTTLTTGTACGVDGLASSMSDSAYGMGGADAMDFYYVSTCTQAIKLLSNRSGAWSVSTLKDSNGNTLLANAGQGFFQVADLHTLYVPRNTVTSNTPAAPSSILKCTQPAFGSPWSCSTVWTAAGTAFAPGPIGTASVAAIGGVFATGSNELLISDSGDAAIGLLRY